MGEVSLSDSADCPGSSLLAHDDDDDGDGNCCQLHNEV